MEILGLTLIGLMAGGVVNWLADTLPIYGGWEQPHCHACRAPRPLKAWLGISAWITGAWRCSYCGIPRRPRLIVVELLAAAAAVLLYRTGWGLMGFGTSFLILMVFLLLTITDFEHRLIPHAVSLPSIAVVAFLASLNPARGLEKTMLGGLAGFGLVFLLYLFGEVYSRWQARRRGEPLEEIAFGFGDVTLATLIGVAVGWPAVILAIMIGVLAAGGFSLVYILWMMIRGRYQPHLPI
ncbi:MAG: prepilin peptidase, partial [Anaerolineales bacterium]